MSVQRSKRILIVEDEYLLADDLRRILEDEGITVLGPVSNLDDAMTLAENGAIDGAILDINLDGRMVYPLARTLEGRGIPFFFLTGYDGTAPASGFTDVPLVGKPFTPKSLETAIARITGGWASF